MFASRICRCSFWFVVLVLLSMVNRGLSGAIRSGKSNKYSDSNGNCAVPPELVKEIQSYQPTVDRIVKEVVNGRFAGDSWNSLAELVDKFGPRYCGTDNFENSIDYMVGKLNEAELENVHTENATVPRWRRGYESAQLVEPHAQNLPILGCGDSVGTPKGGIVGDAIVVESFDDFAKLSDDAVQGKIVVFAQKWVNYSVTVGYRVIGASTAAKKGAIAVLIRSITDQSIGSPHAGLLLYDEKVPKIPAASITVEDAAMLLRIYKRGDPIKIRLEMDDEVLPSYVSRNTIAELHGFKKPVDKKVVVVSGHLDSWDVGVGAMDDGGGAFISWKAIEYLKKMDLRPARTIRAILWTCEEFATVGSQKYQEAHAANEKEEFNFFFESDIGTFEPTGLDFEGNADAECLLKEILKLMKPLNATAFDKPMQGGPDIENWTNHGFSGASLMNKNERYFWYHHTAGDSMLLEDPANLDKAAALFAASTFIVANLTVDMPNSFH